MLKHAPSLSPDLRDVIGAWLVCCAVAAGCFGLLPLADLSPQAREGRLGSADDFRLGALISSGPPATVAGAATDRTQLNRHGRC